MHVPFTLQQKRKKKNLNLYPIEMNCQKQINRLESSSFIMAGQNNTFSPVWLQFVLTDQSKAKYRVNPGA